MHPRFASVRQVRDQGVNEQLNHLVHVAISEGPSGNPPKIELVRGPGVQPVNGVTAEHNARTD